MRHRRCGAVLVLAVAVVPLSACAAFPEPPASVGQGYPSAGVPSAVRWPSDWLAGLSGESDAVAGPVVGLRLERLDAQWVWRIRSVDRYHDDLFGERRDDPTRGREALLDATDLDLVRERTVTLTAAEATGSDVSAYDAAQRSGEAWPGPRLVELELRTEDRVPVWRVTTYDTDSGALSTTTLRDDLPN